MKILSIFGTRPEAIKMAPIVNLLKEIPQIESKVCVTAQHRQMLDQVLNIFDIRPDYDLNLMKDSQSLTDLSMVILDQTRKILEQYQPDWVLVQGDTTTAFISSLAAFYNKIAIAHVEAGLRTRNRYSPWPEEMNRKLIGHLAHLHFAPTHQAAENLIMEGIDKKTIIVSGNTVIDALLQVNSKLTGNQELTAQYNEQFAFLNDKKKLILVTSHRRENFGENFAQICKALIKLANRSDLEIIYPVHLNPNIRNYAQQHLSQHPNIHLLEPLDYVPFIYLMKRCYLILTDSGGIQEEAPSLGKPILILRDTTERGEAVERGAAKLIGTHYEAIVSNVENLIENAHSYNLMSNAGNPYGDGKAAYSIVNHLLAASNLFSEVKYENFDVGSRLRQ